MESERMSVPEEEIYNWFVRLREKIDGIPSHFVYNMDEMGHQEYADAKPKTCIVPSHVAEKPYYSVSRRGKRITLIACVAADGSYVTPALIIPRVTYEDELAEYGLTDEKIVIYSQKNAFIDRDIFFDWLKDVFQPDLVARRIKYSYSGKAYLLLDNCSAHFGPDVHNLCADNNLELLYIPPHSSHFLQCLDVSVFGITKNLIRTYNRIDEANI
jgi:hypothetical protein